MDYVTFSRTIFLSWLFFFRARSLSLCLACRVLITTTMLCFGLRSFLYIHMQFNIIYLSFFINVIHTFRRYFELIMRRKFKESQFQSKSKLKVRNKSATTNNVQREKTFIMRMTRHDTLRETTTQLTHKFE